jgi:hypothetical protein
MINESHDTKNRPLYSPLRGCSDLAASAPAKIPRRRIPRNFKTGSNTCRFDDRDDRLRI